MLELTTFGELPIDVTFQIVWTVPGPAPEPPPQTVFTKIAPLTLPGGVANAIYASDSPDRHHAVAVPDDWRVLRVAAPILTVANES